MTPRRWAILIAVFFIGFLIPELWAYRSGTPTLSQSVWLWSDTWWPFGIILSFSVGFLFGHLFWHRKVVVKESFTTHLVDTPYDISFDEKSVKASEEALLRSKRRPF